MSEIKGYCLSHVLYGALLQQPKLTKAKNEAKKDSGCHPLDTISSSNLPVLLVKCRGQMEHNITDICKDGI